MYFSEKKLIELEEKLQYKFKNKKTLKAALCHSSIKRCAVPFERLEFLGDRILGIVIAEYIYKTTQGAEGTMARMNAAFVCSSACYEIAMFLGLNFLIQTAGTNLKNNKTVLADSMEALLGAIFTDSNKNYSKLEKIILKLWLPLFKRYNPADQEPKTQLQEISQSQTGSIPIYQLIKEEGEKHNPTFTMLVSACGMTSQASGNSKKEAETNAAIALLKKIRNEG